MFCPVCDSVRMKEVERDGVMIDICPGCKGIWLDRGELEKLLQNEREWRNAQPAYAGEYDGDGGYGRSAGYPGSGGYDKAAEYDRNGGNDRSRREYADKHDNPYAGNVPYKKYKKKRSVFELFEDLFD